LKIYGRTSKGFWEYGEEEQGRQPPAAGPSSVEEAERGMELSGYL